jgi:RHS repeat-associated protein
VIAIAHNRVESSVGSYVHGGRHYADEKYLTFTKLDAEGKPLWIRDARGNLVMQYITPMKPTRAADEPDPANPENIPAGAVPCYDVAGNLLYQHSMDAGERWMLGNAAGNPMRRWDSRRFTRRTAYDELQRPTHLWVQEGADPEWLAEATVYGEKHSDAGTLNLRGQTYQQYDGAGVVTSDVYDFKGNLLRGRRRLASNYKTELDWSAVDPFLRPLPGEMLDLDGLEDEAAPLLETEQFESSTVYDALNRPIQQITPHHAGTHDNPVLPNVIQPVYNEANLLDSIDVWLRREDEPDGLLNPRTADQHPVTNIDYNAKGQRIEIAYGNNVVTTYTYDRETFRLSHLLTRRNSTDYAEDCPDPPVDDWPGCHVQNLRYTYDPTGNITHIRDDAQQTIFFRNQRVEPSAEYTYDALYRLIEATGREHLGQNPGGDPNPSVMPGHTDAPRVGLDHPGNGDAMGTYSEWYEYDGVGNILSMRHRAASGGWHRRYDYAEDSNHLMASNLPGDAPDMYSAAYTYDAHGSMTSMPHLHAMQWDFKDQLHEVDLEGGGTAFYVYDAAGQRVRKVHEHNGATVEERIYLGGFEIYRRDNGCGLTLARETLHIVDGQQRVALIEIKTGDTNAATFSSAPLLRYQLSNHLGSACVELAGDARVISYEEYCPYGSTSYQATRSDVEVAAKQYRYTGMERDGKTGLNYHMARYYAPWLGQWTSCDPAGLSDGNNLYRYSRNSPIRLIDHTGRGGGVPNLFREQSWTTGERYVHIGPRLSVLHTAEEPPEQAVEHAASAPADESAEEPPEQVVEHAASDSVDEMTGQELCDAGFPGGIEPVYAGDPGPATVSHEPGAGEPSGEEAELTQQTRPPISSTITEDLVQDYVRELRPEIPQAYEVFDTATFDSPFFQNWGAMLFDFRGTTMQGWEVNYYFIAMALANQGYNWLEAQMAIVAWNALQAGTRFHGYSEEVTSQMWFAAREGFFDEQRRLQPHRQPPRWEQMQMAPQIVHPLE